MEINTVFDDVAILEISLLESLSHRRWCLIPVTLVYRHRYRCILGLAKTNRMMYEDILTNQSRPRGCSEHMQKHSHKVYHERRQFDRYTPFIDGERYTSS